MKAKQMLRFMIAVFFSIGIVSISFAQDAAPSPDKPTVAHKGHLKPGHPHKKHKGKKGAGKNKKSKKSAANSSDNNY